MACLAVIQRPAGPQAIAMFDSPTKHNVPRAFADYRNTGGTATIGYAICEPFSRDVKVGGHPKDVIVQVFERRVLTYTASNARRLSGRDGQHRAALLSMAVREWRFSYDDRDASPPAAILNGSSAPIRPGVPPPVRGSCPIIYPVKGDESGHEDV